MSNQWLNDLHNKMEDHESDVPDGLWDDIKDELFSEDDEKKIEGLGWGEELKAQGKNISKINFKTILYRAAAVAAVIAMFFVGNQVFKLYNEKEPLQRIVSTKIGDKVKINNDQTSLGKLEERKDESVSFEQNNIFNKAIKSSKNTFNIAGNELNRNKFQTFENQETSIITDVFKTNEKMVQETRINNDDQSLNQNKSSEILKNEDDLQDKLAVAEISKKTKRPHNKSWMLSLLAGNTSPNSAEQFPGYATLNGSPMTGGDLWHAAGYEESPLNAVLLANQNEVVKAKIQHKIPVTLGISMYYNLGKKWGIGTGINYTKLSSELRSGSESNFIKSDQTIHYIGVPVQVNYNVIQKGAFTGYVTAGALIEKSVAASVKTKYVVNDEVRDEVKENLEAKPFQFSVNTAVGVQLKVANKIGVYAEPGIGYHFKDNSSLNTIYKEKPFNFNMNFGIRLLIDK